MKQLSANLQKLRTKRKETVKIGERVGQNKYTRVEKANVGYLLIKLNLLDQIKMKAWQDEEF